MLTMGDDAQPADLFLVAAQARRIAECHDWGSEDEEQSDDDDNHCADATRPMLLRLPDGNMHVCKGLACPHSVQSSDTDRTYTCTLSGRLIALTWEASHDSSWTGRSCGSADPDMHSGCAVSSAWRNKRNAMSASASAYSKASSMCVDDVRAMNERPAADSRPVKRGAPCVVDVDDHEVSCQKRSKALKRVASLQNREVQTRLFTDASSVVVKLFSVVPQTARNPKRADPSASIAPATATIDDPRLENIDFVLKMGLRRFVARCKNEQRAPTISGIHDVAAAASAFVKGRQKEASAKENAAATRRGAVNGQTVEMCARLIFALWNVLCNTPYFLESQTGDCRAFWIPCRRHCRRHCLRSRQRPHTTARR